MKYILLILISFLIFTACSTETEITNSAQYHTEEISVAECCADVEGYTCYFGPLDYNQAELVRVSSDSTSWIQVSLVFVPGQGVQLDCQTTGVYRLTWN